MQTLAEQFFVDAMSPAFRDDPYPLYDAYRSEEPLLRVDATIWFALAHPDVVSLLRDPRLSSDETRAATEVGRAEPGPAMDRSLLFMDPPDHTRLRGLVSRAFTPRRIADLRDAVAAMTTELLDDIASTPSGTVVDLVEALAYPLPVRAICALLGVPESDEPRFRSWSAALTRAIDPSVLRTAEDDRAIADAEVALAAYLDDLVARRRRRPSDDLLSGLVAVEADGDRVSTAEVIGLASLLLVAGHETTVNLIGNGVLGLLRHPEQLERLRRCPELLEGAIDELLRFDSPVQLTQRIATEDLALAGRHVRAGDEIILVLGAANRDPAAFPRPHELDVTRDARRHVSFGGGIHHCLGASLARMEAELAIGALLTRFRRVELAGEPTRRPTFTLRGLETLPVAVSA